MATQNFFKIGFFAMLGIILILLALVITMQSGINTSPTTPTYPTSSQEVNTGKTYLVTRVIDGDTIEIEGGTRVRYIGIDTPERGECFGEESTKANSSMVLNKKVKLETEVQQQDRYNRQLAYVYIDNVFVNEELVKLGFAKVATFPPNVKYTDKFIEAQRQAREQNRGLWAENVCSETSSTSTQQTNLFDTNNEQVLPAQTTNDGCAVKGNISTSGEKIYHAPGQNFYEKTKIEESKGERWFCTEEDAINAGWRKSKT